MSYDRETEADLVATMLGDLGSAAVVRFNVAGRDVMDLWDLRHGGPYQLKAEQIAEFNSLLNGSVVIVARRDDTVENVSVESEVSVQSA